MSQSDCNDAVKPLTAETVEAWKRDGAKGLDMRRYIFAHEWKSLCDLALKGLQSESGQLTWHEHRWKERAEKAEALLSEKPANDQGADAIALLALLAVTPPIMRWREYEERGEERIPCFIQVETAKAISEFFPYGRDVGSSEPGGAK